MNHKILFIKTLCIALGVNALFLALAVLPLYVHDAYQLQNQGYFDQHKFDQAPYMRVQARGIIRNVDFDSVIMGTSMMENTSSKVASQLFGGRFVNLSMAGSNFYERDIVLRYLFKHKSLKNVIFSFDNAYIACETTSDRKDNWEYLYFDNVFLNLYAQFEEKKIISAAKKCMLADDVVKKASFDFFDRPTAWMYLANNESIFGGVHNWVQHLETDGMQDFLTRILPNVANFLQHSPAPDPFAIDGAPIKNYIDTYVLKNMIEHPEVQFYVVLPPYYRYFYAAWRQLGGENYFKHKYAVKYLVQEAEKYPNIHIYGFEDQNFVDAIENYKDTTHYHENINTRMLELMHEDAVRITATNVGAYLERCERMALAFDIGNFNAQVQKLLNDR